MHVMTNYHCVSNDDSREDENSSSRAWRGDGELPLQELPHIGLSKALTKSSVVVVKADLMLNVADQDERTRVREQVRLAI